MTRSKLELLGKQLEELQRQMNSICVDATVGVGQDGEISNLGGAVHSDVVLVVEDDGETSIKFVYVDDEDSREEPDWEEVELYDMEDYENYIGFDKEGA